MTSAAPPASLPQWFRYCLASALVFNLFGVVSFAPPIYYRAAASLGFPTDISPFGFWVLAAWILWFGLGYGWLAIYPRREVVFIAVAAACKITLGICLIGFWATGYLPNLALMPAGGDFAYAIAFILWLLNSG